MGVNNNNNTTNHYLELISLMEDLEHTECNIPAVFAEMFKDEINAIEEHQIYNGIKRVIKKYAEDKDSIEAIDEFFRVISGGTALDEIIHVSIEEVLNPTPAFEIRFESNCNR